MRRLGNVLAVFWFLSQTTWIACAAPLEEWRLRNPLSPGPSLYGVSFGAGSYIAVGEAGAVFSSTDSVNWSERPVVTTKMLRSVTYGGGTFVAVGEGGTIFNSVDGVVWKSRDAATTNCLYSIAYGNGLFVCVGTNGTIRTSPDGLTWSGANMASSNALFSVVFDAGLFIAVGQTGGGNAERRRGLVLTSQDGVHWTQKMVESAGLRSVAHGNGVFVALEEHVGDGRSPDRVVTSTNAVTWTLRDLPGTHIWGITFGKGVFIAAGFGGDLAASTDGTQWTAGTQWSETSTDLRGNHVTFVNELFVVVGPNSDIWTSTGGKTWMLRNSGPPLLYHELHDVAYGNDRFIALGQGALVSTDGIVWTESEAARDIALNANAIVFGKGRFVATGWSRVYTSTNGASWALHSLGPGIDLSGAMFANDLFVAVGSNYSDPNARRWVIFTSSDGLEWTQRASGGSWDLYGVTYGDGKFVAAGWHDLVISTDGMTWVQQTAPENFYVNSIAYGNGVFVAVGGSGLPAGMQSVFRTSIDGVAWSQPRGVSEAGLGHVAFHQGVFVGVGGLSDASLVTSTDGTNWLVRNATGGAPLRGVAFGQDTSVVVGYHGTVLQSGNLAQPLFVESPRLASGGFDLALSGQAGRRYAVESSTDLREWFELTVVTAGELPTRFRDTRAAGARRFYRARLQLP